MFDTENLISDNHDGDFYAWLMETEKSIRNSRLDAVKNPQKLLPIIEETADHIKLNLVEKVSNVLYALIFGEFIDRHHYYGHPGEISDIRKNLNSYIEKQPSLISLLPGLRQYCYLIALSRALPRARFFYSDGWVVKEMPVNCPFTIEQILDDGFYPYPLESDALPASPNYIDERDVRRRKREAQMDYYTGFKMTDCITDRLKIEVKSLGLNRSIFMRFTEEIISILHLESKTAEEIELVDTFRHDETKEKNHNHDDLEHPDCDLVGKSTMTYKKRHRNHIKKTAIILAVTTLLFAVSITVMKLMLPPLDPNGNTAEMPCFWCNSITKNQEDI